MQPVECTVQYPALRDPASGRCWNLASGATKIGRAPDCPICLSDPTISRQHCVIELDASSARLVPVSERSPTYVNGRVHTTAVGLRHRDEIRIGERRLEFLAPASQASDPAAAATIAPNRSAPAPAVHIAPAARFPLVVEQLAPRVAAEDVGNLPAPAGLGPRFASLLVDHATITLLGMCSGIVIGAIVHALLGSGDSADLLTGAVVLTLPFFLFVAYFTIFDWGPVGGTPGRRLLGLRVVDADGRPLTFARSLARAVARLLGAIPFGAGFLVALVTQQRQALHDLACSTLVTSRHPHR